MCRTLALAGLLVACAGSRAVPPASPMLGKPLALAAAGLDGVEVRIHAMEGNVRIVDFWASWCEPCRDQLPFLDRLVARHAAAGLSAYAVSFDEDRAAIERFLAEVPVSFPILWDKGGATFSERFEVTRLPTTLLVDRRGVVREVLLGYDAEHAARLEDAVRRLLSEPP